MNDEHHDNSYEDTGEIVSRMAHIAYASWRGPDFEDVRSSEYWAYLRFMYGDRV
jgi:hypothetical protein